MLKEKQLSLSEYFHYFVFSMSLMFIFIRRVEVFEVRLKLSKQEKERVCFRISRKQGMIRKICEFDYLMLLNFKMNDRKVFAVLNHSRRFFAAR